MDILVLLEDGPDRAPPGALVGEGAAAGAAPGGDGPLAHVNSIAPYGALDPLPREVVTLYGVADVEALALALAAAVEGQRIGTPVGTIRHLGVWAERGAVGDAAWRDQQTGQLRSEDFEISAGRLRETARTLLAECGSHIRQMVAGLMMPDWPEGVRRAINFSFHPAGAMPALAGGLGADALLDSLREADGNQFEGD